MSGQILIKSLGMSSQELYNHFSSDGMQTADERYLCDFIEPDGTEREISPATAEQDWSAVKPFEKASLLDARNRGEMSGSIRSTGTAEWDHFVISYDSALTQEIIASGRVNELRDIIKDSMRDSVLNPSAKHALMITQPHTNTENLHFHVYKSRFPIDVETKTIGRGEDPNKTVSEHDKTLRDDRRQSAVILQRINDKMRDAGMPEHWMMYAQRGADGKIVGIASDKTQAAREEASKLFERETGGVPLRSATQRVAPDEAALQALLTESQREAERALKEKAELEARAERAMQQAARAQMALDAIAKSREQEQQIAQLTETVAARDAELDETRSAALAVRAELEQTQTQLEQSRSAQMQTQAQLDERTDELAGALADLEAAEEERDAALAERDEVRAQVAQLTEQIGARDAEIQRQAAQLAEMQREQEAERERARAEAAALKDGMQQMRDMMSSMQQMQAQQADQYKSMTADIGELRAERDALRAATTRHAELSALIDKASIGAAKTDVPSVIAEIKGGNYIAVTRDDKGMFNAAAIVDRQSLQVLDTRGDQSAADKLRSSIEQYAQQQQRGRDDGGRDR